MKLCKNFQCQGFEYINKNKRNNFFLREKSYFISCEIALYATNMFWYIDVTASSVLIFSNVFNFKPSLRGMGDITPLPQAFPPSAKISIKISYHSSM